MLQLLLLAAASWTAAGEQLLITNARIWTGNPAQPWAEAALIDGNRIIAAGPADAVGKRTSPSARRYDAGGRFAMPGFQDAHIHFLSGSLGLANIDLTGICTLPAIQKAIAGYAQAHPEKTWITGRGWEYYCFPNQRLPTREDIDAVVAGRPVFLSAYDGHTGWANSKALERADINRATRFEGFGEIVKDPRTGEPTGALKEGAMGLVQRRLPSPSRDEKLAALRQGMRLAAQLGITSMQNASGNPEEISLYQELSRRNELTVRMAFAMSIPPGSAPDAPDAIAALRARQTDPLVRIHGVKLMIDGVIESFTAAMLEPYANKPAESGSPAWTTEAFQQMVARCDRLGLQVFTHAIGDRGVRLTLDAYEQARRRNGRRDARHRIEHIETIHPDDLPRFAALGVLAAMQPIHADPDTIGVWSECVGPKRLELAFAWQSVHQAGARLVFGSDWPASISVNPLRGIHNAVNRRTVDGKPAGGWIPAQRVSLDTALRGYTTTAAYAGFRETRTGAIRPGMLADLVILSQDPFRIDPIEIHKTRVHCTIFDGRIIYDADGR